MQNRIFLIFVTFYSIFSFGLSAEIWVKNSSGRDFHVSFHGEVCRQFDVDRYNYFPCAQVDLGVNETTLFESAESVHKKLKDSDTLIPRISFNSLGFSYICKVKEYEIHRFFLDFECAAPSLNEDAPKGLRQGDLLTIHGASLSAQGHYQLEVLPGYGYFPQPYVDCRVLRVIEAFQTQEKI